MRPLLIPFALLSLNFAPAQQFDPAQQPASPSVLRKKVDPTNSYERIIVVVPMVGTGKASDPIRPKYAPAPAAGVAATRAGILGYTYILSDDKQSAIVEFVARDLATLQPILNDSQLTGKAFAKSKSKRSDVEKELKKYRKDFSFDNFRGPAVQ